MVLFDSVNASVLSLTTTAMEELLELESTPPITVNPSNNVSVVIASATTTGLDVVLSIVVGFAKISLESKLSDIEP